MKTLLKLSDLEELKDILEKARKEYKYQPILTKKLDSLKGDFTETTLLEIVLWKVNRYPEIKEGFLQELNSLRDEYDDAHARSLFKKLLVQKGFDLPMASTLFRFAFPNRFQIIDQRVYRFIMPGEDCLNIPHNIDKKIELYFEYLTKLRQVCEETGIPFEKSDRILYQLDKIYNKEIQLKTSNSKTKNLEL